MNNKGEKKYRTDGGYFLRDTNRSKTAESSDAKRGNIHFRRAILKKQRLAQEAPDTVLAPSRLG